MPKFKISRRAGKDAQGNEQLEFKGISEGPNAADAWANYCDGNKTWPSPKAFVVVEVDAKGNEVAPRIPVASQAEQKALLQANEIAALREENAAMAALLEAKGKEESKAGKSK